MLSAADIKPSYGVFWPEWGELKIFLEPFLYQGERVETSIRYDLIGVPDLRQLQGMTVLADNPEGASIYFHGCHHPVDIEEISFGSGTEKSIPVAFSGTVVADALSSFESFRISIEAPVLLPLSKEQIDQRVHEAIQFVQASGPRDVGRVMARIRSVGIPYGEQLAEISRAVADVLGAVER